jgi:hypothetical protein
VRTATYLLILSVGSSRMPRSGSCHGKGIIQRSSGEALWVNSATVEEIPPRTFNDVEEEKGIRCKEVRKGKYPESENICMIES